MQEQVMRSQHIVRNLLVVTALATSLGSVASPARADANATAPAKPVPSGPLKAYKGPEGETVIMVEASDGTQMLVHCKSIDPTIDGKTLLYLIEDLGKGNKNVYINKKRGSKTYRSVLLAARENRWEFFHPIKHSKQFTIRYSEEASEKFKVEDVLNAYNP